MRKCPPRRPPHAPAPATPRQFKDRDTPKIGEGGPARTEGIDVSIRTVSGCASLITWQTSTSHAPKKLNLVQACFAFLRTGCVSPSAPLATFRDQLIISLSRTSTARIESLPSPTCTPKASHYGHAQGPTDAKSSHLGKALLVGRDLGCLPLKLRHKLRQLQLSQAHPIQKRVSRTCKRMVACDGQSRAASRTGRIRPAPCPAPGRRCIA